MTATAGPGSDSGAVPLHFVFLQGMPCAFFSRIADQLQALGCRTTGVSLCLGDRIFWRGPCRIDYRGGYEAWPQFIARYFDDSAVTDLVLLGEQRRYHREAVAIAQARGIRVSVTDFGYLRPDWITLERDGMTGGSRFPRGAEQIRRIAAAAPAVDLTPRYADNALRMSAHDLLYNVANLLGGWCYPHYRRSDNRPHTIAYTASSARRMLHSRLRRGRMLARVEAVLADAAEFFVFPLQLSHDFQIVAYSPFEAMADAIHLVVASFARSAPERARLVVKLHPWDPGIDSLEAQTKAAAERWGIGQRVVFVDGGDLDAMMSASRGVVTVNSTSGLRALQLGKPVKTLGEAVYDIPGLTHRGTLDEFWMQPQPPQRDLVDDLVAAMAATIQIRGVFFREPGLSAGVDAAVSRLFHRRVGLPAHRAEPGNGSTTVAAPE